MSENGSFIKKKGFTITGNSLVRNTRLTLKSKGLYLLISSYITLDELELTRSFLQNKCAEGEKAFSSAWDELKEMGYLKTHLRPSKKGWQSEYELLDEPQGGAHTFYHSIGGDVTNTNLTVSRQKPTPDTQSEHTPQKGSNANGTYAEGIYAQDSNAKGGNNIILSRKTLNKTSNNTQSINQPAPQEAASSDRLSEDELREEVEDDFLENKSIPYHYHADERKMLVAVKTLADWYEFTPTHFRSDFEHATFDMLVDCLADMACADGNQTYKGSTVTYAKIIDQMNAVVQRDGSLYEFAEQTVDDYMKAASEAEIRDKRKYMKAVIWNSFLTYRVKFESDFARTFAHA